MINPFECSCGLIFESITELNEHKWECPVHRKKIIRSLPPHQGKRAVTIGVKDVIKDKKATRKDTKKANKSEAEESATKE